MSVKMTLAVTGEWKQVPVSPHAPRGSELHRLEIGGYSATVSKVVSEKNESWDWGIFKDHHELVKSGRSFRLDAAQKNVEAEIWAHNFRERAA